MSSTPMPMPVQSHTGFDSEVSEGTIAFDKNVKHPDFFFNLRVIKDYKSPCNVIRDIKTPPNLDINGKNCLCSS
jgi:hypothetical protein